jgi:hypothetical protein
MKPSLPALLVLAFGTTGLTGSAWAADCASEAAVLAKEQTDLPRLEFSTPADKPPYCITLETLIAFAARVKAHAKHCPDSDYAQNLAEWEKSRANYSRLFSRYRCRRTLR